MSVKRLLRRLSRVAAADAEPVGAYEPIRQVGTKKPSSSSFPRARHLRGRARAPAGHVPLCVGEEGGALERYAVRVDLLGGPAFAPLLRRAAQEYGYARPGALRIPCPVADFNALLLQLHHLSSPDDDDFNALLLQNQLFSTHDDEAPVLYC